MKPWITPVVLSCFLPSMASFDETIDRAPGTAPCILWQNHRYACGPTRSMCYGYSCCVQETFFAETLQGSCWLFVLKFLHVAGMCICGDRGSSLCAVLQCTAHASIANTEPLPPTIAGRRHHHSAGQAPARGVVTAVITVG